VIDLPSGGSIPSVEIPDIDRRVVVSPGASTGSHTVSIGRATLPAPVTVGIDSSPNTSITVPKLRPDGAVTVGTPGMSIGVSQPSISIPTINTDGSSLGPVSISHAGSNVDVNGQNVNIGMPSISTPTGVASVSAPGLDVISH